MKRLCIIAAMAVTTLAAQAQERLTLSTYNGTNIEKFDGKICNVTTNRLVFHGWNTIALPFAMSESEINETFGQDCRLEKLVGAQQMGTSIQLNFQDCKAKGLEANTPYILYYTGETANKKIAKEALISNLQPSLTYEVKGTGETVTMGGVQSHIDGEGLYGILAADNSTAKFVKVATTTNGFYATRCFVKLSSGNQKTLVSKHLAAGETTAIDAVAQADELVDVFNTAGVKVASKIRAAEVSNLQPNVYIVKGQKVVVK